MSVENGEGFGNAEPGESVEGPGKGTAAKLGTKKIVALVVVVALLVAIPLGYLALTAEDSDGDDGDDGNGDSIALSIVGRTGAEENVTLSEIIDMESIEAISSYQNRFGNWRGFGTYQGVNLSELADLVGGMEPGDVMTLTGSDGYCRNLSYYQVYPDDECLAIQGPSILAYMFNETLCPGWEDGPMVAMLAPDQAFSNDDFNNTCAKDPEFLESTSAGSVWVRNVENIQIQSLYEEWTVNLTNLDNVTSQLTRTRFVNLAHFNNATWTDSLTRVWTGAMLPSIIGLMDDDDPMTFDEMLADTEYQIEVSANDGYSKTMIAKYLVENDTLLANMMNGSLLTEDYAPLRLVGSGLTSGEMVSTISSITMLEPQKAAFSVAVAGKTVEEIEVTDLDLDDMEFVEAVTSYQNAYGNWRGLGTYGGVELRNLADLVGGMEPGDVMTVTAVDGYRINLTYYQVYPDEEYLDVQGPIILAYEFDGALMDEEHLPMTAVLAPDEAFSNDDFFATCARDPEFLATNSASALFVKTVARIEISELYEEWIVNLTNLDGVRTEIPRTKFVSLQYFDGGYYVDSSERNWSGVPAEVLLGLVDDDDPSTFNATLADSEYRVVVEATDGYYRVMVVTDLVDIDAIFAIQINGTALPEDIAPVRLVGPDMSGKDMVSMICNVTMDRVAVMVTAGEESAELTISELAKETLFAGSGYFMKSTGTIVGPLSFTGVPIKDLVDMVYAEGNYSLEVVAWDGYSMTYTPAQVENGTFPLYDLDGTLLGPGSVTMMLAIEEDGVRLPYNELRIVLVDDDSTPVTDGHFWAKMVKELNIIPYVEEWTLELSGVTSMEIDRQTFESLASCYYHTTYYNYTDIDGDHSYEGVPLWVLVSAIDGGDAPDGHYMFNDALAEDGYTVNVTASDGWYGLFSAEQIARNDSIIVAHQLDGEPLEVDEWPLRIVGDDLPGSQKVKMIASIAIENFTVAPAWNLTLIGLTTEVLTEWDFVSLYNCEEGVHISYHNYTVDTVEYSYAGIPLWVLIGMVDGADDGHWVFNDSLAALGYQVKVSASDGYNRTFSIEDIQYNSSLIVALTLNGSYLTGDEYPLKLTGEDLPSFLRIKAVASIELINLPG